MQIFKKATIFILLIAIKNILSAQKIKFRGLDFDDVGYEKVLKKAKFTRGLESLAAASSLKMYALILKVRQNTIRGWRFYME